MRCAGDEMIELWFVLHAAAWNKEIEGDCLIELVDLLVHSHLCYFVIICLFTDTSKGCFVAN